jgi:ATP-dependent Lhr-like helicase
VRTTPITLSPRRHVALWRSLLPAEENKPSAKVRSTKARAVLDFMTANGASFFDELVQHCGLLRTHVEEALAELVGLGLVTSDSFAGLRTLLVPASERRPGGRRRRRAVHGMEESGRWSPVRPSPPDDAASEHVARTLLARYGVVFWRMLERESPWLPPWRELLRVYRRLESRGEIRGGRFVAGFTGEQFALPEAIGALREVRRQPHDNEWLVVSGADPLNLAGILTPGPRLAALAGNRLLVQDGVPAAMLSGGEVRLFAEADPATDWLMRKALLGNMRRHELETSGTNEPSAQPARNYRDA